MIRVQGDNMRLSSLPLVFLLPLLLTLISACGGGVESTGNQAVSSLAKTSKTIVIAGIPDQEASILVRRFEGVATYLSKKLGVPAKYVPTVDYSAVVTGFRQGDIHLGWYGGLTGVQARLATPGAQAIAQRPQDERFHSVFIAGTNTGIASLADLKGKTFTFGSESSTSGHLMPRYYIQQVGLTPEKDFNGAPGFSGSHDRTAKLVESGAYQAGALNEDVWKRLVQSGQIDTSKVNAFYTTPAYYDYHWVVRPDLDKTFGAGFTERLTKALLEMGQEDPDTLKVFDADHFITTKNENYKAIESVSRSLGIVQ
ncbi:MAG: putative selenate ABC transporter substrate-binding protein [Chloroflexi bacterium]|nr:putative selenate ABC transporter substrate-binding protein [Chloroflexota bacterium]